MTSSILPAPTGINREPVTGWLVDHVGVTAPLRFELMAGGASNLTFAVTDATGRRLVLRRPPITHVLAGAHDMCREYRLISALATTKVPVPPALGLCTDESVNGAAFYVMDYVEGAVISTKADGLATDAAIRPVMVDSLVDTLAELHAIDPDDVGLGDLGRRNHYCARQLHIWKRQIDVGSDRDLPLIHHLHKRLTATIPTQQGHGIVHGDYRLDNCIMGADGKVAAVLDWELCTLGDVLADVAGLLIWWGDQGLDTPRMSDVPTAVDGFGTADQVLARYAQASPRDLSVIDWYLAYQFWRLACIIEGVRVRHTAGAMGEASDYDDVGARKLVDASLARCQQLLNSTN